MLGKHVKANALRKDGIKQLFLGRPNRLRALIRRNLPTMLAEIVAGALHFLTRRDLDKASAVSKWLDALIAQCCDVDPLRPVASVTLRRRRNDFTLFVVAKTISRTHHSFKSVDESVRITASTLRRSYVELLEVTFDDSE